MNEIWQGVWNGVVLSVLLLGAHHVCHQFRQRTKADNADPDYYAPGIARERDARILGTRLYQDARAWIKWVQQGRPRNFPVVINAGTITKCRHGYAFVENWYWDCRHMDMVIDFSHMIDVLGVQYGVTRVQDLEGCPSCETDVTV